MIWQRMAQAIAFLSGRSFTTPDDVRTVAGPVLELRLTGNFDDPKATVEQIFDSVAVPN